MIHEEYQQHPTAIHSSLNCTLSKRKDTYPAARNARRINLTDEAKCKYTKLYFEELYPFVGNETINTLLQRRPTVLLRLAMLFALTDEILTIGEQHIEAANAWVKYWRDSVVYVFGAQANVTAAEEAQDNSETILRFLEQHGEANRKILIDECFKRHITATKLDSALNHLLTDNAIECVEQKRRDGKPGRGSAVYQLKKNTENIANFAIFASLGKNTEQTKDRKDRSPLPPTMTKTQNIFRSTGAWMAHYKKCKPLDSG